jgi:hypothetical protein
MRPVHCTVGACLFAVLIGIVSAGRSAPAAAAGLDGISDQSLPAWDGSFSASPLADSLRGRWGDGPLAQVSLARYVLQWDAPTEASGGPDPRGTYRERFEAWLNDVRSVGLVPVLALTSYDGVRPRSPREYGSRLEEILGRAAALGEPIPYVEAWNEPNNQGRESPARAAEFANVAHAVCTTVFACRVIAGDFEDTATVAGYEIAYEKALNFLPDTWGIHPYVAIQTHSDAGLLNFKANLPNRGLGVQIWLTEVGAFYCRDGELRGQERQAVDASYLVNTLIPDPQLAPAHAFYYGFLYRDHLRAPCAHGVGDDTELYGPDDTPRAAASVVLGPMIVGWQLISGLRQQGSPGVFDWPNVGAS